MATRKKRAMSSSHSLRSDFCGRRESRVIWALLLVLCFATTPTTAGPIRLDDDNRTEEGIRADDGTPPPFDNDSSAYKTTSDNISVVNTTPHFEGSSTFNEKDLKKIKNGDDYEEYTVSDEQGTTSATTTQKENVHNIKSARKFPSSYESNILREPLNSEEDEDTKQKNSIEKYGSHTDVQLQTDEATLKNEISTIKNRKEEQNYSFDNSSPPFNDDSPAYKTASDNISVVNTTASEGYSTSTEKILKKIKNGADYEEYTVSDEQDTTSATTTQKENVYNTQSAGEIPSRIESDILKTPVLPENHEDIKSKNKIEKHGSRTAYKTTSDIIYVTNRTSSEGYSISTENVLKKYKNGAVYGEYVVQSDEQDPKKRENPLSFKSKNLNRPLISKKDENIKQYSDMSEKSSDGNVIPYKTPTVKVGSINKNQDTAYYSHSTKNSSQPSQEINFVSLENTATDGIQNSSNRPLNRNANVPIERSPNLVDTLNKLIEVLNQLKDTKQFEKNHMNIRRNSNVLPPDDVLSVYNYYMSTKDQKPPIDENPFAVYVEKVKWDCLKTLLNN